MNCAACHVAEFVHAGRTYRIEGAPNVHLFGRRPYAELPGWCKGFDVALLPFTVDDLTIHANPLKLREYLAAGLPVVSTAIPESRALGDLVHVADSAEDFIAAVGKLLRDPGSRKARSRRMAGETWDEKVLEIERHLLALEDPAPRDVEMIA